MKHFITKTGLVAGILFTLLSLTGCGNESGETTANGDAGISTTGKETTDEYVYVPYNIILNSDSEKMVSSVSIVDDKAFFILESKITEPIDDYANVAPITVYMVDLLKDNKVPEVYLTLQDDLSKYQDDGYTYNPCQYMVTDKGEILGKIYGYKKVENKLVWDTKHIIIKRDKDGNVLFCKDVTEYVNIDPNHSEIKCMNEDKKGNIFLCNGVTCICMLDEKGEFQKSIQIEDGEMNQNNILGMNMVKDGRTAYISHNLKENVIRVFNERTKDFSEVYDIPSDCFYPCLSKGLKEDALIQGTNAVYDFSFTNNTCFEVLKWMDVDLDPNYVRGFDVLSNEQIALIYRDNTTGDKMIKVLKRQLKTELKDKVVLTLGGMNITQTVEKQVVWFNRMSSEYNIEIKNYTKDINWNSQTAYEDYEKAITQFNNDLIAGTACDMFVASDLDLDMYLQKGIIEDLSPYLLNSSKYKKEDFIKPVLDAYTIDGKICTIPLRFSVFTICGPNSVIGDQAGWKIEDMIAYANQNPGVKLFPYACNTLLVDYCLTYDFNSYIDWKTGECNFHTDDFKKMLELAKTYPSALDIDYSDSETKLIRNHEALLYIGSFTEPISWQLTQAMFNEPITVIGFPCSNSTGVKVNGNDGICINTASEHKEAAWEFIESFFGEDVKRNNTVGFPTYKERYDQEMQECMVPNYEVNQNDEIILDDNGEPIEAPRGTLNLGGDVILSIYATKQEEADAIWEMINKIDGPINKSTSLVDIINEELFPYFDGQKNMEEVIDIIEKRVNLYVNERR